MFCNENTFELFGQEGETFSSICTLLKNFYAGNALFNSRGIETFK